MKKTDGTLKDKKKGSKKMEAFIMYCQKGKNLDEVAAAFDRSTRTIRRWINEIKTSHGRLPPPRKQKRARPRKYPDAVFARIIELKEENPPRTGSGVHRLLKDELGGRCPSVSTIRKHLRDNGLSGGKSGGREGYEEFARDRPNDLWQIDIAGPQWIPGLGTVYLHAMLDDCSRLSIAPRYHKDQRGINVLRMLRDAFEEHGLPSGILADNGTQFKNTLGELNTKYSRLLALLEIEAIFAKPHHPQTKGKIERFFRTVAGDFIVEARFRADKKGGMSLEELNKHFREWIHWYNHEKPHEALPGKQPPATVYFNHESRIFRPLETVIDWDRWFLTVETRKVTKYNTISYKKETIQLPKGHAGLRVEVFDAGDVYEVYYREKCLARVEINFDYQKIRSREFERKVSYSGTIKYKGEYYYVGQVFTGKKMIVKEMDQGRKIAVYLDGKLVKEFNKK